MEYKICSECEQKNPPDSSSCFLCSGSLRPVQLRQDVKEETKNRSPLQATSTPSSSATALVSRSPLRAASSSLATADQGEAKSPNFDFSQPINEDEEEVVTNENVEAESDGSCVKRETKEEEVCSVLLLILLFYLFSLDHLTFMHFNS